MNKDIRLNEYDKSEWCDIARVLRPDWTPDQFDEAWGEFCEARAQHLKSKSTN